MAAIHEHHLSVSRTARYYMVGDPGGDVAELWFALHGYGQLASHFLRSFESLATGRRLFVAPEGLSRFYVDHAAGKVGASWMTREDRVAEIADYVRYLDALHAEVSSRLSRAAVLGVLGFSQGTATALRWLAHGAARAERVIVWGGEIPPDVDLGAARERLVRAELVIVAGAGDEYITPKILARDEGRLRALGIPYRVRAFDGGHELDAQVLAELIG